MDMWRWKDAVLGDGRDFFVPRPKSLQKLALFLQDSENPNILECVVLSNCARFEILLVVENEEATTDDNVNIDLLNNQLELELSRKLVLQQFHYKLNVNPATKMMVSTLDWPDAIASQHTPTLKQGAKHDVASDAAELQSYWTHLTDVKDIMDHLARVASGLALRPRRPDRPVEFRPFSSRDAHILLQLKRTVQAFSSMSPSSPQIRLVQLLQFALQAGKAARNPQHVPQLLALQPYGSGDSQKYSSQPPAHIVQNAIDVSQAVASRICV